MKKPTDFNRIDLSVTVDPLANPPHPFLEILSDAWSARLKRQVTTDEIYERGFLDDCL